MISAVVLTKNASQTLEKCLTSLSWCDEIVVVDDRSIDKTPAIAKQHNARVYTREIKGDFSKQRNFALEKASYEWVFFVDSDEVVPPALREEVQQKVQEDSNSINGYFVRRQDYLWKRALRYGEMGNMWLLRLGRKESGMWEGSVHEVWRVHGAKGRLHHALDHYPHTSVGSFLDSINRYSTLRAEELHKKGMRVSPAAIFCYPAAKFLLNYIFRMGFRDGIAGLLVAVMMSFHSFLVRGKLWQLQSTHK